MRVQGGEVKLASAFSSTSSCKRLLNAWWMQGGEEKRLHYLENITCCQGTTTQHTSSQALTIARTCSNGTWSGLATRKAGGKPRLRSHSAVPGASASGRTVMYAAT